MNCRIGVEIGSKEPSDIFTAICKLLLCVLEGRDELIEIAFIGSFPLELLSVSGVCLQKVVDKQNVSGSISIKHALQSAVLIVLETTGQKYRGTPIQAPSGKSSALMAVTIADLPNLIGIQKPIQAISIIQFGFLESRVEAKPRIMSITL